MLNGACIDDFETGYDVQTTEGGHVMKARNIEFVSRMGLRLGSSVMRWFLWECSLVMEKNTRALCRWMNIGIH